MKDQYFGDINDYRKYGLLRILAVQARVSLGIWWLLTPADHRGSGELRAYLSKPAQWRRYDTELYDKLRGLLTPDLPRRVTLAKDWAVIPRATYFEESLPDDAGRRAGYFARATTALDQCDLWFFDPDIGIEIDSVPRGRTDSSQYVYWTELRDAFQRGHSLLVYQHFPRVNRDRFVPFLASRLADELGSRHVIGFRTAHVAFLLVGQERHAARLAAAAVEVGTRWSGQIAVWTPLDEGGGSDSQAGRAGRSICTRESCPEEQGFGNTGERTMPATASHQPVPTILLIAASRGLGRAMAEEFLKKGWHVVGTVRDRSAHTKLHELAAQYTGRLEVETLDICDQEQIAALRQRLSDRMFEMLFVNAGITNDEKETIEDVTTDEFIRVMVTNALSPMRVVEALQGLVSADGLIGVMSSGQGSVTNNVTGMREVYRGSKAALNQFMRSYAARHAGTQRALVLMAPGWVRTEMGGPDARLSIDESVPNLVNVLLKKRGNPGLEYLDYQGRTVPW